MPKVKLMRDTQQERATFRRNLIESKAHLRGYRTQTAIEQALNLPAGWMSKRMSGKTRLELDDLCKLDKLLRFDAQEMAQLVRCRE